MLQRPPADDSGGAGLVAKIQYGGIKIFEEKRSRKKVFPGNDIFRPNDGWKYRRRCAERIFRMRCFAVLMLLLATCCGILFGGIEKSSDTSSAIHLMWEKCGALL
ncbi:MAG: hypothetical protein ACLRXC_12490, partial [[Clostridium] leptum]